MADAQSVLRAQAGAAANKSLGAAAARAGEGLGARCQAPAPAGSSLAPSEPVLASPQHLGREVIDQGWWALSSESCPGPRDPSEMHSWGSTGTQGTDRIGHPNSRPLRPSEEELRLKADSSAIVLRVSSMAGAATPPGLNLSQPARTHGWRQALPHNRPAVIGFAPGQGGASQSPFCFLFLPMPPLEAGHRLPGGDMKEEETQ